MMERNDRVATTVEDLRREVAELKARADSERAVLRTIFARLDREDTKARTAINALLTQRDELHDVADVVLDAVEVLRLQVSRLQSQIDLLVGVNRVH
jgi:chromosome segregation ATPase